MLSIPASAKRARPHRLRLTKCSYDKPGEFTAAEDDAREPPIRSARPADAEVGPVLFSSCDGTATGRVCRISDEANENRSGKGEFLKFVIDVAIGIEMILPPSHQFLITSTASAILPS
jgi:hypothetical protein